MNTVTLTPHAEPEFNPNAGSIGSPRRITYRWATGLVRTDGDLVVELVCSHYTGRYSADLHHTQVGPVFATTKYGDILAARPWELLVPVPRYSRSGLIAFAESALILVRAAFDAGNEKVVELFTPTTEETE